MKNTKFLFLIASVLLASCAQPNVSSSSETLSESTASDANSTTSTSEIETQSSTVEDSSSSDQTSSSVVEDDLPALEDDPIWNVNGALNSVRGAAFREMLANSIKSTGSKTCSYSDLWDYLVDSDASKDGTGIRPFYHSPDDKTSKGSCNKEHTWPDSRGAGKSGPGSDPQIIRPTISSENSSRGNKYFGEGSSEFDPASFGYDGARGECARIIFYAATRYWAGSNNFVLNNNPGSATSLHSMGTLKTLLKWNAQYPVNEAEVKRNKVLDDLGFARNPFIDHPEYAKYIWADEGLRDSQGNVPEPSGEEHRLVKSIDGLQDAEVMIVADVSTTYLAMMGEPKREDLPWYINGAEVGAPKDGIIKTDNKEAGYYTFTENSDHSYTIETKGKALCSYVDVKGGKTYYSICLGAPTSATATSSSDKWNVSIASDGKVTMYGVTTNVYLEYYNSSFCGYSRAGSDPLYFYAK